MGESILMMRRMKCSVILPNVQWVINQVVAEAIENGIDGINLDFELVSAACGRTLYPVCAGIVSQMQTEWSCVIC